jgi:hypothetical protein
MCKRWLFLLSALMILISARVASAQQPPLAPSARAIFNPYPAINPSPNSPSQYAPRSPISPYLGLLRGGDVAANYYLEVVPLLQKQRKDLEPTMAAPRLDPKLDEDFKEANLRRSTAGNLPSFGNYYGAYGLPNQRGYIPYAPPALGRPMGPIGPMGQ